MLQLFSKWNYLVWVFFVETLHRSIDGHNHYNLLIFTIDYSTWQFSPQRSCYQLNTWQCLWLNLFIFKLKVRFYRIRSFNWFIISCICHIGSNGRKSGTVIAVFLHIAFISPDIVERCWPSLIALGVLLFYCIISRKETMGLLK